MSEDTEGIIYISLAWKYNEKDMRTFYTEHFKFCN